MEIRLSDLWSIFDFTHPGLLGSDKVFAKFTKRLAIGGHFGQLRALAQPYILRRLKTDSRLIDDLPAKTEFKASRQLSPAQAALYQRAVQDLATALEDAEESAARACCCTAAPRSPGGANWLIAFRKTSRFLFSCFRLRRVARG